MKCLPSSLLILAVFPLVVVAKRRRVPFMNCPSTKSSSGLGMVKQARSRIECSVICLNNPECLSASYCKSSDGYTCQLSQMFLAGGCSGLPANGDCTQTFVVYPCENGGTFFHENRTCHCVDGFIGDYCHRRYRDCQETPLGNVLYTIQPFRSDYTFQWKCGPFTSPYTRVSEYASVFNFNYTLTWEQMKQGITPHPGFYFTGPETLHQLTKQGVYDLFIRMIVLGKNSGYVIYKHFRVDSEAEGYACHWKSFTRYYEVPYNSDEYLDGLGALGDSTKSMKGARFGTFDNDVSECAGTHNFAWWYNPLGCTLVTFDPDGLNWPTNRTGTVEIEKIDHTLIGLRNVYWYVEDDLIL
ncbi:uncharacterized protein [Haliotis cracherodii]|uniref:uncharacterized protein n=1 Tax=Haliotis cracherodii TaxID=6455 RepID=UPI0039E9B71C